MQWRNGDWCNGCVRRTPLDCHNGDGFVKYPGYKMPDTWNSWFDRNMSLRECEIVCLKNCSCMAYANLDIRRGGSGCLLWFDELIDMRELNANEQDIYVRMASFELGILMHKFEQGYTDKTQNEDLELSLFALIVIADSTIVFSINNKLGEGGFGPVYKGILEGGQEIAVKRLLMYSSQGLDEFKNEVIFFHPMLCCNGYMSLECAIDGLFSVKSDVFSFGILVLEIVSGKKNRGFYHPGHRLNLLGHAKEPGFFTARNVVEPGYLSNKEATTTCNEITVTLLSGR
ncbi:hypothetical protein TEA_006530 [Camellia sinensis var. sinensis]|uniref:Apple domain-containing protein n=1 Tax=Camellia sinensis var. sinensis TaxID=542762 RepID=A0A4V3WME1_CAMSN|nr:hypothetical protein TEA_006530 [Camellia sinensis var. sinensis]